MIRLLMLAAVFVLLVVMLKRWQTERRRRAEANAVLNAQVGKRGVATEPIDKDSGLVRVGGEAYAARTDGDEAIAPRTLVEIVTVFRFRLVVRKLAGGGHLMDVDQMTSAADPPDDAEPPSSDDTPPA